MLGLLTLLLTLQLQTTIACKYGDYYHWDAPVSLAPEIDILDGSIEEKFPNISIIKNHVDRNLNRSWGGWTPPPNVVKEWRDWLHAWELQNNDTDHLDLDKDPELAAKLLKERGIGSEWPSEWLDVGEGQGGSDPPPWAFVPKNTGKPSICLLPARYGRCKKNEKRWGYNPYLDECQEFIYSGCGGNHNNFLSLKKCQDKCVGPAPSGCDTESNIYIENVIVG